MMDSKFRSAWKFFHENAAFVVGQSAICAMDLARAETTISDHPVSFRWEYDPDPDLSWMSDRERAEEHVCEIASLQRLCPHCDSWETVASLCGIVDADEDCRRVVNAELALEYLNDLQRGAIRS